MTRYAHSRSSGAGLLALCFAAFTTIIASGCDTPVGDSLWDNYDLPNRPNPQITAVDPPDRWWAGIETMTITGQNFSPVPAENLVYFDNTRAQVLEASPTQLVIRTPNLVRENITLRVSVLLAPEFSNVVTYHLDAAVAIEPGLLGTDRPWAIDVDAQGNLYMSYVAFEAAAGILQITPEGERINYTPPRAWRYANIRFGPDGSLFMVRGGVVPIIYRVPPGGGTEETWLGPAGLGRMQDLAFDDQGVMWAGGENEGTPNAAIFRIDPDKNVERFPFDANVRSIRVHDGHLYVAANRAGQRGVWRFPITAQHELGPEELVFDYSAQHPSPTARVLSIEFTAAGEMFIGTDAPEGLILVRPDGSWEDFYPGLIPPRVFDLAWGAGSLLYAVIVPPEDLPDAGGDQTIVRIETLKPGPR